MTYEAWRISFQSSEAAARSAFEENASLRAELASLRSGDVEPVYVIFDGPPSPDAPRFVEVETKDGFSVGGFELENHRGTDYWRLGPFYPVPLPGQSAEIERLKKALHMREQMIVAQAKALDAAQNGII